MQLLLQLQLQQQQRLRLLLSSLWKGQRQQLLAAGLLAAGWWCCCCCSCCCSCCWSLLKINCNFIAYNSIKWFGFCSRLPDNVSSALSFHFNASLFQFGFFSFYSADTLAGCLFFVIYSALQCLLCLLSIYLSIYPSLCLPVCLSIVSLLSKNNRQRRTRLHI